MPRGRILHLAWRYPPCNCSPTGSARNHAFSEGLARLGWDVTVLAGRAVDARCACWSEPGASEFLARQLSRVVVVDSRTRWVLRTRQRVTGSSAGAQLLRRLLAASALPFDATTDFLRRCTEFVDALGPEEQPDVVLLSGRPMAGIATTVAIARRHDAVSVIHLHDSIVRMAGDRGHPRARAASLRRALRALHAADVAMSISPEEAARDARRAHRPVVVVEGGFDTEMWRGIERASTSTLAAEVFTPAVADAFRVVYTGRLYDFQDPDLSLRALGEAADRNPDAPMALCVFGPDPERWHEAAEHAGVGHLLHHLGMVDRTRASVALKHAHVALLFGRQDRLPGNYGQKLYDYLASGAPILFSPGSADDSGAVAIAEASAGCATTSPREAAAFLGGQLNQWVGRGRGEPLHLRTSFESREAWSFDRRVEEVDAVLTAALADEKPPVATDPRVLIVIDRIQDLGGAEGSTALAVNGLQGHGAQFGIVALYGIELNDRAELEDLGARFYEPESPSFAAQVRCVLGALTDFEPDLVHTVLARSELVGRLAASVRGVPVMTSIVNMQYSREARALAQSPRRLDTYQKLDAVMSRRATFRFHAISAAAAESAASELGIDPARIRIVTRGRDSVALGRRDPERRSAARASLGLAGAVPTIVNVGRQELQKGQGFLISAMQQVAARHPGAQLLVAGRPGAATPSLLEQLHELHLDEHVTFLGMRNDVPELLCAADVFAFPSLYEGLGGALIEALALEVPIVAFDVPAVREAVGECAILVPPGNDVMLADAIIELLDDAERASQLTHRGRERFEDRFTNDRYLQEMLALYQEVTSDAQDAQRRRPSRFARSSRDGNRTRR